MKTLSEIARWMFINIVPRPDPRTAVEVINGKSINLKLYHEGFGSLPVVAGIFGTADFRISLNPPVPFAKQEIVILLNIANGPFENIRVPFDHAALTEALIALVEREDF